LNHVRWHWTNNKSFFCLLNATYINYIFFPRWSQWDFFYTISVYIYNDRKIIIYTYTYVSFYVYVKFTVTDVSYVYYRVRNKVFIRKYNWFIDELARRQLDEILPHKLILIFFLRYRFPAKYSNVFGCAPYSVIKGVNNLPNDYYTYLFTEWRASCNELYYYIDFVEIIASVHYRTCWFRKVH